MHKFFTPKYLIEENMAKIQGDDVKHIYKVLRLQKGEKVVINDLEGTEYLGEMLEVNKTEAVVKIIEKLDINNESSLKIHLFQGMPKAAKMDLIVQKGVELGIREITPIITNRVDVKHKGEFKKLDRLNKIALEASKQSKRTIIPRVLEPLEWSDFIGKIKYMDLVVVPYENQNGYGIKNMISDINNKQISNIAVVIGPEGGFEEKEIEELKSIESYIVTLGPRILRTETAGFITTAILQYELGDVGGEK